MVSFTRHLLTAVFLTLLPGIIHSDDDEQPEACPTPVEGCLCQYAEMECEGLSTLPDQQDGIMNYVFNKCTFGEALNLPLPYANAVSLQMIECNIKGLSSNAFENMLDVETIEINRNFIDRVKNETFSKNGKLRDLRLINNRITTIEAGTLREDYLPLLEKLDISSNPDIKIYNFFEGVSDSVTELDIENCDIAHFPEDFFLPFSKLKILDIGRNHLHKISDQFSQLGQIEHLSIYHCMISEIEEDAFEDLTMLSYLDLENNNLLELNEGTFSGQSETLRTLNLKKNNLTALPKELLTLDKLVRLDLTDNPWDCDCDIQWMGAFNNGTFTRPLCVTPAEFKDQDLFNVTAQMTDEYCEEDGGLGQAALVIIIVLLIGCAVLLAFLVYKCIISNKRQEASSGAQYSAVYQQTNEPKKTGMANAEKV